MKCSRISLTNNTDELNGSALDYYDSFSEKVTFLNTRIGILDSVTETHRARYNKYKCLLALIITPAFILALGTPLWMYFSKETNQAEITSESSTTLESTDEPNDGYNYCFNPVTCVMSLKSLTLWAVAFIFLAGLMLSWTIVQGEKTLRETIKRTLKAFNQLDNRRQINWRLLESHEYLEIQENHPSELQEIFILESGRIFAEILVIGIEKFSGSASSQQPLANDDENSLTTNGPANNVDSLTTDASEKVLGKGQTPSRPPNAWILYHKNFQALEGQYQQNLSAVTTSARASLSWKELPKNERHAWTLLGQIAEQKHNKIYQ
ncbi:1754_t:CDS:2 [Ambispora leptoticha]|uniref:1754_t:CDS:1 n=1 Tax=Ambispora leptoticha TaxID=144679 RepID=A0A9N8Z0L8_9GLOM|nr:1754_t:CDS:2 [Ambispora leptoticha]